MMAGWHALASRSLATLALVILATTLALTPKPSNAGPTKSKAFMVSALLKRKGSDTVVKLVHSRVVAIDAAEARRVVLRHVESQYTGYAVIDTLTSNLGEAPACTSRPQLWTRTNAKIGAAA